MECEQPAQTAVTPDEGLIGDLGDKWLAIEGKDAPLMSLEGFLDA